MIKGPFYAASTRLVSCPDCFFLCFGWEKGSGVTPIAVSLWIPRFWGLFEGQKTSRQQWNRLSSCSLHLAQYSFRAQSQLQQVIETWKHLARGLFTALQTIPRIWGFRTKRLLELHQTLFPHPKHRKKRSGHETTTRFVIAISDGFKLVVWIWAGVDQLIH